MRVALAQIITGRDLAANLVLVEEYARRPRTAAPSWWCSRRPRCAPSGIHSWTSPSRWTARGPAGCAPSPRSCGIVIVAGMFTPGTAGRGAKVRNTLLVTGPGVEASYDKIHLFDAFGFAESDTVDAGAGPVTFELDGLTFGLATCYDVRFPDLFTANADRGADVNIVCASWGSGPGKAEQWQAPGPRPRRGLHHLVLACGQGDPATPGHRPSRFRPHRRRALRRRLALRRRPRRARRRPRPAIRRPGHRSGQGSPSQAPGPGQPPQVLSRFRRRVRWWSPRLADTRACRRPAVARTPPDAFSGRSAALRALWSPMAPLQDPGTRSILGLPLSYFEQLKGPPSFACQGVRFLSETCESVLNHEKGERACLPRKGDDGPSSPEPEFC